MVAVVSSSERRREREGKSAREYVVFVVREIFFAKIQCAFSMDVCVESAMRFCAKSARLDDACIAIRSFRRAIGSRNECVCYWNDDACKMQ